MKFWLKRIFYKSEGEGNGDPEWINFKEKFSSRYKKQLVRLIPFGEIFAEIGMPLLIFIISLIGVSILWNESLFSDGVQQAANYFNSEDAKRKDIVVVTIDDQTLSGLDRTDSHRRLIFDITNEVNKYKPIAIGLDYVFLPEMRDNDTDIKINNECNIEDGDGFVVVGSILGKYNELSTEIPPDKKIFEKQYIDGGKCSKWGHLFVSYSMDVERVRTVPLTINDEYQGRVVPSLALQLWMTIRGSDDPILSDVDYVRNVLHSCEQGDYEIIDDSNLCKLIGTKLSGERRVRFNPIKDSFDVISASEIVSPVSKDWLAEKLSGKYVLIGDGFTKSDDFVDTPLGSLNPFKQDENAIDKLPGVYVHAYTLGNIISESLGQKGFIEDVNSVTTIIISITLILVLLIFYRYIAIYRWIYTRRGERKYGNQAVSFLSFGFVLSLMVFVISAYVLHANNTMLNVGVLIPLILGITLIGCFVILLVKNIDDAEYDSGIERHAHPHDKDNGGSYKELLGNEKIATLAMIITCKLNVDRSSSIISNALSLIQSDLIKGLDEFVPELLPIIDNWGFNSVAVHVLYPLPESKDSFTDNKLNSIKNAFCVLVRKAVEMQEIRKNNSEVLSSVDINILSSTIKSVDVISNTEKDVITFCGPVYEHRSSKYRKILRIRDEANDEVTNITLSGFNEKAWPDQLIVDDKSILLGAVNDYLAEKYTNKKIDITIKNLNGDKLYENS